MKILIKVTKEVLQKTMMCNGLNGDVTENCAFAYAVRELFPRARVNYSCIHGPVVGQRHRWRIELPRNVANWIVDFDLLNTSPLKRLDLPEISFEAEVPEEAIDSISIREAYRILSESKTLELVHP